MSGHGLSTKGVGLGGVELATKGLVDPGSGGGGGGGGGGDEVVGAPRLPPGLATRAPTDFLVQDARVLVTVPTAINLCLIAAENITGNLRARQSSDLALPSLYRRAYLVAYETDEVAIAHR